MLFDLVWVVSDDPILKTGTLVVMWTVSCIAYLLFALMLTRYMDHRPVRAAGLVFNRRAAKALLVGTGISTVVICCVTAVSHVLGLVVPSPPIDGVKSGFEEKSRVKKRQAESRTRRACLRAKKEGADGSQRFLPNLTAAATRLHA